MTQNEGKKFEKLIRDNALKQGFYYLRLQDNLKFGGEVKGARFSQKSPYDSILFATPYLLCLELKSTGSTSLSFGKKGSCNIKEHQIKELEKAASYNNTIPGFLVQFRARETKLTKRDEIVFFIHIKDFLDFIESSDKKSISFDDCSSIGVEIPKINIGKRVVKYEYRLCEAIDIIKDKYKNYLIT